MDFDEKVLLNDCILIGMITKGIFNYKDIKELKFNEYDFLVSSCLEISKSMNKSLGDDNNG